MAANQATTSYDGLTQRTRKFGRGEERDSQAGTIRLVQYGKTKEAGRRTYGSLWDSQQPSLCLYQQQRAES